MDAEVIYAGDPLVLIASIPASCESRKVREHEAGLHLLSSGMQMLELPMNAIQQNKYGKPRFENNQGPFFSISHSQNMVACAISNYEVGCDIEKIENVPHILDREIDKVRHLYNEKPNNRENRTTLWTIYEAIAKCIGTGIPIDNEYLNSSEWNILTQRIKEDYVISVARRRMADENYS